MSVTTEKYAALGRVAALVAEGATASELFTTVVEELVAVLDVPAGSLLRYDPNRAVSVLAAVNDPGFPVGSRWQLDGPSLSASVLETGGPARIEDYSQLEGTIAATARESGHGSALGVPITVDGLVWGLICVCTRKREPLPADAEARLRLPRPQTTGAHGAKPSRCRERDRLARSGLGLGQCRITRRAAGAEPTSACPIQAAGPCRARP